jgi:hypothetical protein
MLPTMAKAPTTSPQAQEPSPLVYATPSHPPSSVLNSTSSMKSN